MLCNDIIDKKLTNLSLTLSKLWIAFSNQLLYFPLSILTARTEYSFCVSLFGLENEQIIFSYRLL